MKNKNHGGKRENSGRKKKFGVFETTTISFRCPKKFETEIKKQIAEIINRYENYKD